MIVIDGLNGKIICVNEAKGAVHDFEIFKQSGIHILDNILLVGDKGFQGICAIHPHSLTRHVNRRIKRFKILQIRYRNKQRKHLLRVSLICGIYNCELQF